ncbi:YfcE family phosphodiesterase [Acutalibacter sp. 1XD8-33]|uniref:metallophosphoesterase family protein n=1 Tax=Acutalibacter sp. 1XD8-33 TaxID=2320081 RepID=UPI000EA3EEB0|nr:YfcE family phosphodiesterase [Acutalibacter sp. 1XD8-33]RKJ38413.1 YfcE family phosphodiesterase [Acutalibacter sp. 1XD8-33]
MRILVTSDTHGDSSSLRRAILAQPEAEIVIHLGDGGDDVDYVRPSFPAKTFLQVRGNCDWGSALPPTGEYETEQGKLFFTHGHLFGVKSGDYEILSAARDRKARVVLFGHTHQPRQDYEDGLYIMNPGRLSGWEPTYGTIDLTPQGIVLNIVKLPG